MNELNYKLANFLNKLDRKQEKVRSIYILFCFRSLTCYGLSAFWPFPACLHWLQPRTLLVLSEKVLMKICILYDFSHVFDLFHDDFCRVLI